MRTLDCEEPEAFRLHADAFRGPGDLVQTGGLTGASRLDLHDGALLVVSGDAWSASAR